jgi:hypothetical protein
LLVQKKNPLRAELRLTEWSGLAMNFAAYLLKHDVLTIDNPVRGNACGGREPTINL